MNTVRFWLAVSVLALPLMGTVAERSIGLPGVAVAQEKAPAPAQGAPDIKVKVEGGHTDRTVVWFANPLVLAVGGVGVLLLVLLIVLAARGGGTTIVKD